jgi:hypothetical protein
VSLNLNVYDLTLQQSGALDYKSSGLNSLKPNFASADAVRFRE